MTGLEAGIQVFWSSVQGTFLLALLLSPPDSIQLKKKKKKGGERVFLNHEEIYSKVEKKPMIMNWYLQILV